MPRDLWRTYTVTDVLTAPVPGSLSPATHCPSSRAPGLTRDTALPRGSFQSGRLLFNPARTRSWTTTTARVATAAGTPPPPPRTTGLDLATAVKLLLGGGGTVCGFAPRPRHLTVGNDYLRLRRTWRTSAARQSPTLQHGMRGPLCMLSSVYVPKMPRWVLLGTSSPRFSPGILCAAFGPCRQSFAAYIASDMSIPEAFKLHPRRLALLAYAALCSAQLSPCACTRLTQCHLTLSNT